MRFTGLGRYVDAILPGVRSGRIDLPVSRSGARMSWTSFWIESPKVKQWHRRSEQGLQAAEMLATIAGRDGKFDYPAQSLYHAWLQMLLNMDRNTLWGAAGGMVFEHEKSWDVRDRFESVEKISADTARAALAHAAGRGGRVALFNPLNWARTDPVRISLPTGTNLLGVTTQDAGDGQILCRTPLPSTGILTLDMSRQAAPAPRTIDLPAVIETTHYLARIDPNSGALCSLKLKSSGRELLAGPVLLVAEQAGDFHSTPRRDQRKRLGDSSQAKAQIHVSEGPLATVVNVDSTLLGRVVHQTILFYKDSPRIDFDVELNDVPDKTIVLAEFPLAQAVRETRRGIPYGFSHAAWERKDSSLAGFGDGIVPAIRWSHYQFERGGVALLDRGLPGRELTGRTPTLFLLNAQDIYMGYPCPWLSGRGRQSFSFALVAHDGDWKDARIPQMAWEFNSPPVVGVDSAEMSPQSFLQTSDNVIVEAMRREGSEIEIRLAECLGAAGTAELTLNLPHSKAAITDLTGGRRQPLEGGPSYRFPVRPQQIVTLRFETNVAVADIQPLTKWDQLVPQAKLAALHTKLDKKGHPPEGDQQDKLPADAAKSVAKGTPATASNVYQNQDGCRAGLAFDGDPQTRWASDAGVRQAWLEVDLGQPRVIDRAWLSEAYDRIEEFELQADRDGRWENFARGGRIGEGLELKFPPVRAKKVRLNVLKATDGPTIWEFLLFDAASRASVSHASVPGLDDYNVTWDSPSVDHHGSMPLGNGDITLNAWVTQAGDIQFFIGKSDAWDDNARLVKVGAVRVHLEPNPFADNPPFRQTLSLRDATLKVEAGDGPRKVGVRVWVDANHPVIHVAVDSVSPVEATAVAELWRTSRREEAQLQTSDVLLNPKLPREQQTPMIVEPDTVLADQQGRIGWYHHNVKSVGPKLLAEIQGLTGFAQPDPLLGRTFGAVVTAAGGERVDNLHLRSPRGTRHQFNVFVLTRHPALPAEWLADMDQTVRQVESQDFAVRRWQHEQWWASFWGRSWIRAATSSQIPSSPVESIVPANEHAVRIGLDQSGGNRYTGEIGRASVFSSPLTDAQVKELATLDRGATPPQPPARLWTGATTGPIPDSASWDFSRGFAIEAWLNPQELPAGGARIVDKITPGGADGFLFDTFPGNSLRLICGSAQLSVKDALPAGRWTHVAAVADSQAGGCRIYVNGKLAAGSSQEAVADQAAHVSRMYHLQRFVNACAGRGAYPIKFNGSLFTVPAGDRDDPDYRRWGPGYWWQNTRLPYFSMCTSGDFDLMEPLWRMYAGPVLELSKYRTKLYCGHEGAFLPECIYFWGPVFSETYGWTPFEQRTDKLQESGYHKWEWVGGLELCWMMLDYYEHTLDRKFLQDTAVPFAHEILTFFDRHYSTDAQGKLLMQPSQALETWWECINPMPELAGCTAVTERLLSLPADSVPAGERELWQRLHDKLPPLPLRDVEGGKALAPAEKFDRKQNIENPELYAVFPFRLIAVNRPNLDWGIEALKHRWDKGHAGWRQDDVFMAYLGLTQDACRGLTERAGHHDPGERFPAFWGPNYDWTPDQCHGGVLLETFQSMLMQTDGRKILLMPAWPRNWDVDFKLHAPLQTVIEGSYRDGRLRELKVAPESRRADVVDMTSP
ncbi:MAG: DUF5703 domain-containing protein [Phycisphaerales bacterium]